MTILVIDGYNLLHRARSGFTKGDYPVAFNFFRGLKPLIEKFEPTRVYVALEGMPKRQLAMLPSYKANRIVDASTPEGQAKHASNVEFHRQKDIIIDLLERHFPLSLLVHPDFEGDDVVYNIIKNASSAVDFVVVSTDSDFVQLLQDFQNVRLYNPVTKAFVEAPEHDYVLWKALRGDGSDNIPALVTENEALRLVNDPAKLCVLFEDPTMRVQFQRNHELIRLHQWTDEEAMGMRSSAPTRDWDTVKATFERWEFKSMTKESYWTKFVAAFDPLFGDG